MNIPCQQHLRTSCECVKIEYLIRNKKTPRPPLKSFYVKPDSKWADVLSESLTGRNTNENVIGESCQSLSNLSNQCLKWRAAMQKLWMWGCHQQPGIPHNPTCHERVITWMSPWTIFNSTAPTFWLLNEHKSQEGWTEGLCSAPSVCYMSEFNRANHYYHTVTWSMSVR